MQLFWPHARHACAPPSPGPASLMPPSPEHMFWHVVSKLGPIMPHGVSRTHLAIQWFVGSVQSNAIPMQTSNPIHIWTWPHAIMQSSPPPVVAVDVAFELELVAVD